MGRPVKWSRELHSIRERAALARTETWGRVDIEELFGVGRATAIRGGAGLSGGWLRAGRIRGVLGRVLSGA